MRVGPLVLASLLALLVGCGGIHHLERNAPGVADLDADDEAIPTGRRQPPGDPGERVLEFLVAPYYSLGDWVLTRGDSRLKQSVGLELWSFYFQREESHSGSPVFFNFCERCRLYPIDAFGGTLGMEIAQWDRGRGGNGRPGEVYAMAATSRRNVATLAGGWSLDTRTGRHGLRGSIVILEFVSADTSYHFGGELAVSLGLRFTYGRALVWSR